MNDEFREITPDDLDGLDVPSPKGMEQIPVTQPRIYNLDQESARLKMLEHVYDTPDERLPELTYLARHECADFASSMMFDEMLKDDYVIGTAYKIWRKYFFQLRRSVNARHLGKGYGLAEAGMLTEEKEPSGMATEFE